MKGATKSGFAFNVDEDKLDDYRLVKDLRSISKGNSGLVVDVIERLLGEDQEEKLMEHVESLNNGKCSATGMVEELQEIFEALKVKNSSSSPT